MVGGTPKHSVAWVISMGSKKPPIARDERWALLFAYGWNFPSAWKMSPFHAGDKGKFIILESKRHQEIRQPVSLCIREGYDWKSVGGKCLHKEWKSASLGPWNVCSWGWRDDTVGERPSHTSIRDWFLDPQNPCQTLGVVSHVYNPSTVVGVGPRQEGCWSFLVTGLAPAWAGPCINGVRQSDSVGCPSPPLASVCAYGDTSYIRLFLLEGGMEGNTSLSSLTPFPLIVLLFNIHPGGGLWVTPGLEGVVLPLDHLGRGGHLLESTESCMSKRRCSSIVYWFLCLLLGFP